MSIHPGQILLDRYRVENYIGSGGMGSVFRVWDLQRNVSLAIKVLRGDLAEEPGGLHQLQAEARTLEELAHPNIVAFYGLYQSGEGAFLLEDYVEGESLKDALKKRAGKPFSFEETLLYFKPLCAALQYAHNLAIIHCDVKPGNILRDQRNQIYLADFGIARYLGTGIVDTSPGGTPAYMAPEQIHGGMLTKQTDIYALGVVLYEMLTGGRLPYTGERAKIKGSLTDRIQWEHVNKPPVSPRRYNRTIPPSLEAIILRCLEKEPEKRYPNALDLLNDLLAILPHQPVPRLTQRLGLPKLVAWLVGPLLLATAILVLFTLVVPKIGTSPKPTLFNLDSYPTPTLNRPDALPSTRALSISQAGNATTPPSTQKSARATASQPPEPLSTVLPSTAPAPSPTPRLDYPVKACMTAQLGGGNQVRECITNVHLMPDGSLRFDFTWTANLVPAVKEVLIYSALGNTNMYLVDNLGNHYDFLQAGGDAANDFKLRNNQTSSGWFLFPAPHTDTSFFIFHDDDNNIQTQEITRTWP